MSKRQLLATVALFMAPISTLPQDSNNKPPIVVVDSPDVLKGIKQICLIAGVSPNLSRTEIKEIAELRLLEAGIKLWEPRNGFPDKPGAFILYIEVNTVIPQDGTIIAYRVDVEVRSSGFFHYNSKVMQVDGAIVWHTGGTGITDSVNAKENIVKSVKKYTEKFLLDYLKANPKK